MSPGNGPLIGNVGECEIRGSLGLIQIVFDHEARSLTTAENWQTVMVFRFSFFLCVCVCVCVLFFPPKENLLFTFILFSELEARLMEFVVL